MTRLGVACGALKRGAMYHDVLGTSVYLGSPRLWSGFTLYHLGEHSAALDDGKAGLQGEIFRVGPALLSVIDEFEEIPTLYPRLSVETPFANSILYLLVEEPRGVPEIQSGDWRSYRSVRDQG